MTANNEGKYLYSNPNSKCFSRSSLLFHDTSNLQKTFACRGLPTMQASEFPKPMNKNYMSVKNEKQKESIVKRKEKDKP